MSSRDEEKRQPEGQRWLQEPVGPDEVRIHIDVGESVEARAELRDALDELMRELYADDVEGFVALSAKGDCTFEYQCFLRACQPYTVLPCLADTYCLIRKTI